MQMPLVKRRTYHQDLTKLRQELETKHAAELQDLAKKMREHTAAFEKNLQERDTLRQMELANLTRQLNDLVTQERLRCIRIAEGVPASARPQYVRDEIVRRIATQPHPNYQHPDVPPAPETYTASSTSASTTSA